MENKVMKISDYQTEFKKLIDSGKTNQEAIHQIAVKYRPPFQILKSISKPLTQMSEKT